MSNKKNIVKNIEELVIPILKELGVELIDIEFQKHRNDWFLRIYIDKIGGITIDDCETVSKKVDRYLDDLDLITHSYYLEVSSPGLDRPLKTDMQLKKHLGEKVEVRTYKPINGKRKHIGILENFDENSILIITEDGKMMELDRALVSTIKLVIVF